VSNQRRESEAKEGKPREHGMRERIRRVDGRWEEEGGASKAGEEGGEGPQERRDGLSETIKIICRVGSFESVLSGDLYTTLPGERLSPEK